MKTQISRDLFDAAKRYSGVYQQQGRMLTDADWNELMDVLRTRIDEVVRDAIGSGAPRDRGLKVLDDFRLQPGHLYVDGVHAELAGTAPIDFDDQPDFSEAQALPVSSGPSGYVLYADVWERPVIALEDGELLDPGLHGADTCTRTRTMLQVKWCPAGTDPTNTSVNPPKGDAPLTLALWRASNGADPCDPCAAEVALDARVGNYLFRVEVHDWQVKGDGSAELTLKWSSENGAEQHNTGALPPGFKQGEWVYEFYNQACEENLGVHLATGFVPSRGELATNYPAVTPAGRPWVRRWDGYCMLTRASGGAWSFKTGVDKGVTLSTGLGSDAHGHVAVGAGVELNLAAMALTLGLGTHKYVAGDYWLAAVREAVHKPGDTLLSSAAPLGILHHYLWLADLDSEGKVQAYADDQTRRQFEFPPLSDMWAKDVGYDNENCSMSAAENVQEALDWLCQQRDLRFHNKHLHGWGIVCGLQVECGPDTKPKEGEEEGERRQVRVQKGYAIDCEGNDVVLGPDPATLDLLKLVEDYDSANPNDPIRKEGDGSACLLIARGQNGLPSFAVEKYDPKQDTLAKLLDGTLLMDFYQDCILDLVKAVQGELSADPNEQKALVGPTMRRWIALLNLFIQLFNYDNGRYVFLSPKEHAILKKFYERLQELLRSKTFCAMFEGDEFPEYPFPESKLSTIFGKGWHTRLRLTPDGSQAYTCGAANDTIHVYDLKKEEMIAEVQMPAGEGAKVFDVAFQPDGKQLYAIANLASGDTVLGVADLDGAGGFKWHPVRVLCGLTLTALAITPDGKQLYAIGKGAGLFAFTPDAMLTETTRPEPKYGFNAVGQLSIDFDAKQAWATASSGSAVTSLYNQALGMDLGAAGSNLTPQQIRTLVRPDTGGAVVGEDDILVIPGKDAEGASSLCVVTNNWGGGDNQKHILVYSLADNVPGSTPAHALVVEDTIVRLGWHAPTQRLIASLEDGYRLQLFNKDGTTGSFRHPVQISPIALASDAKSNRLYVLNFFSNTISVIPGEELETTTEFLGKLESYRTAAIAAFWGLIGGLLQYLKDCFCHHLLVNCPECDADDKLYLAGVEIRDDKIYKICNFSKRKYVKSFPTVGYWLSIVPIMPLLHKAVEKFCCLVLPDLFGNIYQKYSVASGNYAYAKAGNQVQSVKLRQGVQLWQGTNFRALWGAEKKGLNVYKRLFTDSALNRVESASIVQPGVNRSQVLETPVDEAQQKLQAGGVQVETVKPYDPSVDADKLIAYGKAPLRLNRGAKVTLYERDGKVMFYTLAEEKGLVAGVSPETKAEIENLERRKAALRDVSDVNVELARVEVRRAEVANLSASREELATLEGQKARVQQEVGALKVELSGLQAQRAELADVQALASQIGAARAQVDALRQARDSELAAVNMLEARRTELAGAVSALQKDMETVRSQYRELSLNINRDRPVRDVAGVDPTLEKRLNELGVRTVNDMANVDPNYLARSNLDEATAKSLIAAAQLRLKQ